MPELQALPAVDTIRKHRGQHAMKTVIWGALIFAVAMCAAATIVTRQVAAATDPPSAADAALFDRLDADHDGRVTSGEISAEHQRLFARLLRQADINKNESL